MSPRTQRIDEGIDGRACAHAKHHAFAQFSYGGHGHTLLTLLLQIGCGSHTKTPEIKP
jgi:hypothetical protein